MTRDESLTIVGMILSHWHSPREWTKEEIDVYARLIRDMDAELTTHAVIALAKEIPYRPSISELREKVRAERRRLAPAIEPIEPKSEPLPLWVKRWICARMLYSRFGKERDMRRFPEQQDFGDLTQEVMPEGAWEAESSSFTDREFSEAFRRFTSGRN